MNYLCLTPRAFTINLSRRDVTSSRSRDDDDDDDDSTHVASRCALAARRQPIREFDPGRGITFQTPDRSEIHNRETCESNPRVTARTKGEKEDANTCCTCGFESRSPCFLFIYRPEKEFVLSLSRTFAGKIDTEREIH